MKRRTAINYAFAAPLVALHSFHSEPTYKTKKRVILEAHRGNSIAAPENTLLAVEQAINIGVHRVEIDLQLSADNKPVVIHDDTLDRTTNGKGLISTTDWNELKTLDAGSWKGNKFKGLKIPLLADVLDVCKGKTMVNIDLKTVEAVPSMVAVIKDKGMEDDVVITGKVPQCVEGVRETSAMLTMFYESGKDFKNSLESKNYTLAIEKAIKGARQYGLPGFLFHAGWITPEIVYAAHLHGLAVNVYDVNTAEMLTKMMKAGVDGIMTDDPLLIKTTLNKD